jgi:hypothetical protein
MTGVALAPSPAVRPDIGEDRRMLQRSDNVLWSIAPPGIMLHHLGLGIYLELDALGYSLWAYLDGARTVEDAVRKAADANAGEDSLAKACETFGTLDRYGFVVERPKAGNGP